MMNHKKRKERKENNYINIQLTKTLNDANYVGMWNAGRGIGNGENGTEAYITRKEDRKNIFSL
jgi:hypothetical protein